MAASVGHYKLAGKDAHNRYEKAKMASGQNKKDKIRNEKFRSDAMVKPFTTLCPLETPFMAWPYHEKIRQGYCKGSTNDDDGRKRPR